MESKRKLRKGSLISVPLAFIFGASIGFLLASFQVFHNITDLNQPLLDVAAVPAVSHPVALAIETVTPGGKRPVSSDSLGLSDSANLFTELRSKFRDLLASNQWEQALELALQFPNSLAWEQVVEAASKESHQAAIELLIDLRSRQTKLGPVLTNMLSEWYGQAPKEAGDYVNANIDRVGEFTVVRALAKTKTGAVIAAKMLEHTEPDQTLLDMVQLIYPVVSHANWDGFEQWKSSFKGDLFKAFFKAQKQLTQP